MNRSLLLVHGHGFKPAQNALSALWLEAIRWGLLRDTPTALDHRLISRIHDFRIYNLSIRYGRSCPHCALGYLIHPRMAKLITEWLSHDEPATGMPARPAGRIYGDRQ